MSLKLVGVIARASGRQEVSERICVSAQNAQKGSDIACEERRQLSRPLCTDWGLRLMGVSSPLRCVTVDTGGDGVMC